MTGSELRNCFGGHWDASDREIHGLMKHRGRDLKIELLCTSKWSCSVFEQGACIASAQHAAPQDAVKLALATLDERPDL